MFYLVLFQFKEIARNKTFFLLAFAFNYIFLITFMVISRLVTDDKSSLVFQDMAICAAYIFLVTGVGITLIAAPLTAQKVSKTLEQLSLSPLSNEKFIISHLGARLMIFLPQLILLLVITWLLYDLSGWSVLVIALTFLVLLVFFAAVGYLIANLAVSENVASVLGTFMQMFFVFSGLYFVPLSFFNYGFVKYMLIMPWTWAARVLKQALVNNVDVKNFSLFLGYAMVVACLILVFNFRRLRWNQPQ